MVWWYPLQDVGLPSVQQAAILMTWVYAEGALVIQVIHCPYLSSKQIKCNAEMTLQMQAKHHAAHSAAHTYTHHVLWNHSKGTQDSVC